MHMYNLQGFDIFCTCSRSSHSQTKTKNQLYHRHSAIPEKRYKPPHHHLTDPAFPFTPLMSLPPATSSSSQSPPSTIFFLRHGSRLDQHDAQWHLTSPTPYDPPPPPKGLSQPHQTGPPIRSPPPPPPPPP